MDKKNINIANTNTPLKKIIQRKSTINGNKIKINN
jgi:hypothetical protein